jgi:hypothetical protein
MPVESVRLKVKYFAIALLTLWKKYNQYKDIFNDSTKKNITRVD